MISNVQIANEFKTWAYEYAKETNPSVDFTIAIDALADLLINTKPERMYTSESTAQHLFISIVKEAI